VWVRERKGQGKAMWGSVGSSRKEGRGVIEDESAQSKGRKVDSKKRNGGWSFNELWGLKTKGKQIRGRRKALPRGVQKKGED